VLQQQRRAAFSGITIQEFKKLRIPDSVMREGILFVWTEKELMYEIIQHFESMGFYYVENLCYVMLDPSQVKSTKEINTTDATSAIAREDYMFITKSHRTLLMLRRTQATGQKGSAPSAALELRHQRTEDVVFDFVDKNQPFKKPDYFVYKLIETLLPKAMNYLHMGASKEQFEKGRKIKMVELWAQDDTPRKGWLKVRSLR